MRLTRVSDGSVPVRAGATGLLVKDTQPAELVRAVETLARGEALLSTGLTRRLIAELASRPEPASPSPSLLRELTARERDVVALVGHGLDNDAITERLVVARPPPRPTSAARWSRSVLTAGQRSSCSPTRPGWCAPAPTQPPRSVDRS